jgi:hypothetical protein
MGNTRDGRLGTDTGTGTGTGRRVSRRGLLTGVGVGAAGALALRPAEAIAKVLTPRAAGSAASSPCRRSPMSTPRRCAARCWTWAARAASSTPRTRWIKAR